MLSQTFEQVGFEEIASHRFSYDLHFRDMDQACKAAFLGGAVALASQKFDQDTRKKANMKYLQSIKQYRNGKVTKCPESL
ncbi:MAG: hypothetical protein GVY08_11985 [Bacteroidetes bacterium]|jgi:hypothetical protein|nr:hypothetical protein [Bacteroidota bacterium]